MIRIVFILFLILINVNLGRSQGDLDYDQAMNFFFSDLEILMNGNDDGFSFGDILREFNGKNLMPRLHFHEKSLYIFFIFFLVSGDMLSISLIGRVASSKKYSIST